jgi:hypothetical protein
MELVVGDLGTFAGLRANGHAKVSDAEGHRFPGLYAAGSDMASIMGALSRRQHYARPGARLWLDCRAAHGGSPDEAAMRNSAEPISA